MTETNFKITDKQYSMCDKNITMTIGDTLAFAVEILDQNGEPFVADAMSFICKKTYESESAIFNKSLTSGISYEGEGIYSVHVDPGDTVSTSIAPGVYPYALRMTADDDVFTVLQGYLTLEARVAPV